MEGGLNERHGDREIFSAKINPDVTQHDATKLKDGP